MKNYKNAIKIKSNCEIFMYSVTIIIIHSVTYKI